jgi:glutamate dehydrogenase/leucine dehydrogenase
MLCSLLGVCLLLLAAQKAGSFSITPRHLLMSKLAAEKLQLSSKSTQQKIAASYNPVVDIVLIAGIERKAKSFSVIHLVDSNVADYLVVLEGANRPHVSALADIVEVKRELLCTDIALQLTFFMRRRR